MAQRKLGGLILASRVRMWPPTISGGEEANDRLLLD